MKNLTISITSEEDGVEKLLESPYVLVRSFNHEDRAEMDLMLNAGKLASALWEIQGICRKNWKYEEDAQTCLDEVVGIVNSVDEFIF